MGRKIKRNILFGAILFLACFAGYMGWAYKYMQQAILEERLIAIEHDVVYMCNSIDTLVASDEKGWDVEKYQSTIVAVTNQIDATPNVYAELFDASYNTLSKRTSLQENEIDLHFNPLKIEKLREQFETTREGSMKIKQKLASNELVECYVYWRWIPTCAKQQNKVLFVSGISQYTVNEKPVSMLINGTVVLFFVSLMFIVGSIFLSNVEIRVLPDNKSFLAV
jgi:hypothetical protein